MAIQISLTVKDDGTAVIQSFGQRVQDLEQKATGAAGRIQQAWGSLKSAWVEVLAVGASAKQAFDLGQQAAETEETIGRLDRQLARYGETAQAVTRDLQQVVNGQLSLAQAATVASRGIAAGFNPEQLQTLVSMAEGISDQVGGTIESSFESLTQAIATGSFRALKQIEAFGPALDEAETQMELLAYATGRTSAELTENEKRQVTLTAVMAHATEIQEALGGETASLADKYGAFRAQLQNIELTLGRLVNAAGQFGFATLQTITAAVQGLVGAAAGLGSRLLRALGFDQAGREIQKFAVANLQSAHDLIVKASDNFVGAGERTIAAFGGVTEAMKKVGAAATAATPPTQQLTVAMIHQAQALEKEAVSALTATAEKQKGLIQTAKEGLTALQQTQFARQVDRADDLDEKLRLLRQRAFATSDPKELESLMQQAQRLSSEAQQSTTSLTEAQGRLVELERQRDQVAASVGARSLAELESRRQQIGTIEEQIAKQRDLVANLEAGNNTAAESVERLTKTIEERLQTTLERTLSDAQAGYKQINDTLADGRVTAQEYGAALQAGLVAASEQANKTLVLLTAINAAMRQGGGSAPSTPAAPDAGTTVQSPTPEGGATSGFFVDGSGSFAIEGGLPAFASGGVVRRPTVALVGEREPELIVPLSRLRRGEGGGTTIHAPISVTLAGPSLASPSELAGWIRAAIVPELRRLAVARGQA